MLKRLFLDNCFRHHKATFTFEAGLTGIVGPNESGKSLIVEMIRYALFGSAALRGKADDYKKLHVELDFTVGGQDYFVVRKAAKAEIRRGKDVLATGTKPVNEAVCKILGYDLTVFDVANSCNQGNVEALSSMRPAERKAMVDKTVGLDQLDDLIAFCGAEGNTCKREAEATMRGLAEPEAPAEEDHRPIEVIEFDLKQAEADMAEYHQLVGFLSRVPDEPAAPETCPVTATVEEMKARLKERESGLQSVIYWKKQISQLPPEQFTEAELDALEAQHDAYDLMLRRDKLLEQGHICCPSCNHEWPVAGDALTMLGKVVEVEKPDMTRRDIAQQRSWIGNKAKIAELQAKIDTLVVPADCTADLRAREAYEAQMRTYEAHRIAWERYNEQLPAKAERFAELEGTDQKVLALRTELKAAQAYETARLNYFERLESYQSRLEAAEVIAAKAEEYLEARKRIQALKVSVKSHLLPSLNKVASILLSQMTGGERYTVEVSDEFDICIDGQAIDTLSGSGKAVANLAIRIALGQILTNRVFSVFMADEVDAAMDDERASYTANALRRLTDSVQQVMLVTHKRPETDHIFELKKK